MSTISKTAKAFARCFDEGRGAWPADLIALGERALLTLRSMDQPAYAKSIALQEASARDLKAFADHYAEYETTCSPVPERHGRSVFSAEAPAGTDQP